MLTSKTNRILLYLSAFIVVVLVLFALLRDSAKLISLEQFNTLLTHSNITKVIVSDEYVYIKDQQDIYKVPKFEVSSSMFHNLEVEIKNNHNILIYILVFIFIVGVGSIVFRWIQKEKNQLKVPENKSNINDSFVVSTQPIQAIKSDVTFDDIGGISDVKVELEEIIDFMRNPQRYKNFGAYMPRGVLLVGPPGVGKTMIAKAVANEANVPFFYQSGASFVQIYVGMGAKRVHELFSIAKKNTPSIIFIDEIDAVGKKRDGQRNDEREATLNQLLTEMDGFEGASGVIVIAATNKIEVLDSALLRAGRFDRRIFVELPTKDEREAILKKYLQKVPHQLNIKKVANMSIGFNGASLAALVNEAALLSLRENVSYVTLEHFDRVKDKVMFGKKKLQILSEEQKRYRITYQSAKVVCATYYDLPFEKLMLSNIKLMPINRNEPLIEHEIRSRIKMLLSGMVACDLEYKQHTSNVKNDLDDAKSLVRRMLEEYGMGYSLVEGEREDEHLLQELYEEVKDLIENLVIAIKRVEEILYEKESVTKIEVQGLLDEVL